MKYKYISLISVVILFLYACGPSAEEISEQKRIIAEQIAEEERLAAEQKAEEERLAAEQKAEEERLAAEQKAEEERLASEKLLAELKRKSDLSTLACNFMGSTRNMDSAVRIREINVTRERIGEDIFLGTDDEIKESFKYGLCKELVINDPEYKSKLANVKEFVAKQDRIKRQKEAEELAKNIALYTDAMKEVLNTYPPKPILIRKKYKPYGLDRFEITYSCENFYGFRHDLVIAFKNNIGELRKENYFGDCGEETFRLEDFAPKIAASFRSGRKGFENEIESIYLEWDGHVYKTNFSSVYNKDPKVNPRTYGLNGYEKLDISNMKTIYFLFP